MGERGLLGTNATLVADISLLLSLAVALMLTIGLILARLRRYDLHRWVQTGAVLLNAGLVLSVMLGSFLGAAAPGIPARLGDPYYASALIHGLAGLFAFGFGMFVMLRGNNLLPAALQFQNYKRYMRVAYAGYLLATMLGVWVYLTWYTAAPVVNLPQTVTPAERLLPMANFVYNPRELRIPQGATVVWVNQDRAPHTITSDDGSLLASDLIENGGEFRFTFNELGTFPYYCELHGAPGGIDMAGIIQVVPADQAPPAATIVAALEPTALPAQQQPALAALLTNGPGLPQQQGYAAGIYGQAEELQRHINLLEQSRLAGDLPGVRRHAEHIYNLIVGSLDPRFGDLDGDGRSQNPGDGFGLLPNATQPGYLQAIEQHATAAINAPDASPGIKLHGEHVRICAQNMLPLASEARDLALRLTSSSDLSAATPDIARLLELGVAIERGVDRNGDGEIAPQPGEGGALVLFQHARFMAGLP